jgi:hypothetical protein
LETDASREAVEGVTIGDGISTRVESWEENND